MTQCLWLLLYSNVRVEATAKQHIFYFFEKRPCVCCSKFLIHCHCPTEFVGSYFPLACELYRNTAPDAGKVQRAEGFSETTETRRERLPFRATRLRDWLKEYKIALNLWSSQSQHWNNKLLRCCFFRYTLL